MVTVRDPYDWFGDDDGHGRPGRRWDADASRRPLEVVRRPELGFELVAPQDFGDAQHIADSLREGVPVLVDLGACDAELRGRLTDFASGLLYALGGTLQDIGGDVLLLSPGRVALSGDDASAVRRPGFFNRS